MSYKSGKVEPGDIVARPHQPFHFGRVVHVDGDRCTIKWEKEADWGEELAGNLEVLSDLDQVSRRLIERMAVLREDHKWEAVKALDWATDVVNEIGCERRLRDEMVSYGPVAV